MSLDIDFEGDARVTESKFVAACVMSGAEIDERREGVVDLFFPGSGLWVFGTSLVDDTRLRVAPPAGAGFVVAYRAHLRPNHDRFDLCMDDVERLLHDLHRRSEACFVVSFQGETALYASSGAGLVKFG